MTITTMEQLFVHGLQDVYYAENQIAKTLPQMVEKASDQKLRDSLNRHLQETREHLKRLEHVFQLLGQPAQGVTCQAVLGLIEEGEELVGQINNRSLRDAALIASAQAVENYEINRYGTLIAWAEEMIPRSSSMGQQGNGAKVIELLKLTLEDEKSLDRELTSIASQKVNKQAA